MMVTPFILFLALASLVQGHDFFVNRFAYNQAMATCLGEEPYYGWLKRVTVAKHQCYQEPVKMLPEPVAKKQEEMVSDAAKKEFIYDGPILERLLTKAVSKTSNYTCLLQKMNYIDENLKILPDNLKTELKTLTPSAELNAQLVNVVDQCISFSTCIPDVDSPMPIEIKRLVFFMRCEKKLRMAICMKQRILKIMSLFDTSALPFETSDQDEMAEKVLHVLWGSESNEEFEIY
ncbi:uncharacterized protein [Palaemon carinicauda]|uniref:uncharacterized protein n=1 Tax=Palaemon carinicauda TaxID=392227 RepID=UPI0035B5A705